MMRNAIELPLDGVESKTESFQVKSNECALLSCKISHFIVKGTAISGGINVVIKYFFLFNFRPAKASILFSDSYSKKYPVITTNSYLQFVLLTVHLFSSFFNPIGYELTQFYRSWQFYTDISRKIQLIKWGKLKDFRERLTPFSIFACIFQEFKYLDLIFSSIYCDLFKMSILTFFC